MKSDSREVSRRKWNVGREQRATTCEEINVGSLQRIADACELMAKNHATLIAERDMFKRWYREVEKKCARQEKQIAAYKRIVARLKRKAEGGTENA